MVTVVNKFLLDKNKVFLGVVFLIIFDILAIWLMCIPEFFKGNIIMIDWFRPIFGVIGFLYSSILLYGHIVLLFRNKEAFIIADHYLIDNSRYESVGKIYYNEINMINRLNKNGLEIVLKEPVFKSRKLYFIQKFLLIFNNWNYKNSIIVSCALLNCERNVLEKLILDAIKNTDKV